MKSFGPELFPMTPYYGRCPYPKKGKGGGIREDK